MTTLETKQAYLDNQATFYRVIPVRWEVEYIAFSDVIGFLDVREPYQALPNEKPIEIEYIGTTINHTDGNYIEYEGSG
jgi:hypothetical protein